MIWPFHTSKLVVEEMKVRERERKERDRLLQLQTGILQKKLEDALKELRPNDMEKKHD